MPSKKAMQGKDRGQIEQDVIDPGINMEPLHCESSIYIDRPIGEVFEFLANPSVKPEELTPLEDWVEERDEVRGVGAERRATVEFAARVLEYVARCTEYEPPHRLSSQFEGDLEGNETWQLVSESSGTRVQLTLNFVRPEWTPAYLRDKTTADRWGQMLVDQTLANVKAALEQPAHRANDA
jgi:uncharacterized protein YndB with AHSA1/START domain